MATTRTEKNQRIRDAREEAAKLYSEGKNYAAIAEQLNARGHKTANNLDWRQGNVWHLLHDPKYGKAYRRGRKPATTDVKRPYTKSVTSRGDIVKAIIQSKEFNADTKLALCQLVLE